jgi:hypothetical protein
LGEWVRGTAINSRTIPVGCWDRVEKSWVDGW